MNGLETIVSYAILFSILVVSIFWLMIFLGIKDEDEKLDKPKVYPTLAIMIPAISEGKVLLKTIKSSLKIEYPRNKYTIYIALNKSSTKETIAAAKSIKNRNLKVIECPMNGKARVMNYVLKRYAKEDLLLVQDADTIIKDNLPSRMAYFFADKKVGAVVASVKVTNPKTFAEKMQKYEYLLSILSRKAMSSIMGVIVTHGAGSMFRMSLVRKFGYFDENNPTEDLEMGLKILAKGYKIETSPHLVSYTVVPHTLWQLFKQRKRWFSGFFYNIAKHRKDLFSVKNAGLTFLVMPLILFSIFIGVFALVSLVFTFFYPSILTLMNWYSIIANTNFSFAFHHNLSVPAFLFFSINSVYMLSIFVTGIGLFSLAYSMKYSRSRVDKLKDTIGMIAYIIFYAFFLSFIWLYTAIAFALFRRTFTWKIGI